MTYFSFQPEVEQSIIWKAHLGVYIKRLDSPSDRLTYILVNKVRRNKRPIRVAKKKIILNNNESNCGTWHEFDIRKVVTKWIKQPHTNLGLQIMAMDNHGNPLAIINPDTEEEEAYVS